jgi:hypothetical protein
LTNAGKVGKMRLREGAKRETQKRRQDLILLSDNPEWTPKEICR